MSATFSEDRTRRYLLGREWDTLKLIGVESRGTLGFVMLNPSMAGEKDDDPTIRKCIGFAKRWNYSAIIVGNLIAVVVTDPYSLPPWRGLYHDNEFHLKILLTCDEIIVAWGGVAKALRRSIALNEHILRFRELCGDRQLHCIGLTKGGDPLHPSRAHYTKSMQEWQWNS